MTQDTQAYVANQVESASPAHLIELLFWRAVRDLKDAEELWPTPQRAPKGIELVVHAQRVLLELQQSLNHGGEWRTISINLSRLYEYMQYKLLQVATGRTGDPLGDIREIIRLLEPLGEAWSSIAAQPQEGLPESTLVQGSILLA
ncbi:MAG: flagellar export chaperone FliS [Planctomycetota bacterium]